MKLSKMKNSSKTESISKIKNFNYENYLYDLIKTMQINIKIILDAVQLLKMRQENKNLINYSIIFNW